MGIINKIWKYIMKRQNPMRYARKMGVVLGENCRLIGFPGNFYTVITDLFYCRIHNALPFFIKVRRTYFVASPFAKLMPALLSPYPAYHHAHMNESILQEVRQMPLHLPAVNVHCPFFRLDSLHMLPDLTT